MNIFKSLLGSTEGNFSQVFGMLLQYEDSVREYILRESKFPEELEITLIRKEEILDSQENRIDLLIELEDGYTIGIENKKWASFQRDQLDRYSKSSHFRNNKKGKIILLTPSRYYLEKEKMNENVVHITYKQILQILYDLKIKSKFIQDVINYFGEVELMPITKDEIQAQLYYASGSEKLDSILEQIRIEDDFKIENKQGVYKLFRKEIGLFGFYIGFRFSNDFYLKHPLLDSEPECIVYLKEYNGKWISEEMLATSRVKMERVRHDLEKLEFTHVEILNSQVKFLIRCKLSIFADKEIHEIVSWFKMVQESLELNFK